MERIATDGTRSVYARSIPSPAGLAVDREGVLFIAAYSGDFIAKAGKDGTIGKVAEGFATPTGIAFASDGMLLVANRSSGEIVKLDIHTGEKRRVADGLSLPVGVVEMPDKSLVVSQYGGRVTRVMPDGTKQELGESFSRPGVGIVADGSDAVLVIDNGAGVVRRVDFQGKSDVAAEGMQGSAVALGRAPNGDLVVGTWGAGNIYRLSNK